MLILWRWYVYCKQSKSVNNNPPTTHILTTFHYPKVHKTAATTIGLIMHFGSLASKRKLPSPIKPVPRETIFKLKNWNNNDPRRQYSIKLPTSQFLEHRQESNVENKMKRANSLRNEMWLRTNLLLTVRIGICYLTTQPMALWNHLLQKLFMNHLLVKLRKI